MNKNTTTKVAPKATTKVTPKGVKVEVRDITKGDIRLFGAGVLFGLVYVATGWAAFHLTKNFVSQTKVLFKAGKKAAASNSTKK